MLKVEKYEMTKCSKLPLMMKYYYAEYSGSNAGSADEKFGASLQSVAATSFELELTLKV